MYRDFGTVLLAALVAIVFVCVPLILQWLVAPSNKTAEKLQTYECGEVVEGSAWLQFNVRFYVIALIFLISNKNNKNRQNDILFKTKQLISKIRTQSMFLIKNYSSLPLF